MKKQVLSFTEFINEAYKILSESEGGSGSIDFLKELLGGGLGLPKSSQDIFKNIIDSLDSLEFTSAQAENLKNAGETIKDYLNSEEEGVSIKQKEITPDFILTTEYEYQWLKQGTVGAKGLPSIDSDGSVSVVWTSRQMTDQTITLNELLRSIFEYNIGLISYIIARDKKTIKRMSNFGKKAKNKKDYLKFLTINEESLKTSVIQVVQYKDEKPGFDPTGEYGFAFPIYTVQNIDKEGGLELSKDDYIEVLPPSPTEKTVEVKDVPYFAPPETNFFGENEVGVKGDDGKNYLTEDGKAALSALLSEFNSISKIVVNGGASSKATSRAGGNEKLAKDRMETGINTLNQLKKDGVEQLKGAQILPGKAEVQSGSASESDPKNQQVSFVVSGLIRKTEVKENKEPIIIKKVDVRKADKVTFKRNTLYVSYDA